MGTTNETPETTVEQQQQPPSTTGTQTEDWEKRYKGLQSVLDKTQKKLQTAELQVSELTAKLEEALQGQRGHETERKSRDDQIAKLTADLAESEKKIASHEIEKERMRLILSEYPELAAFESQGLLPSAITIDELRPRLDAFKETLVKSVDGNLRSKLEGAQPVGLPQSQQKTRRSGEEIYARLTQLAGKNDPKSREEYFALQREWDELNSSK